VQNLALPFSLEIEPPPPDVVERATHLAREVGLRADVLSGAVSAVDAAGRMRIHLARALAFDPGVLLVEHPTATLARHDVAAFGQTIRRVAEQRAAAVLTMTADVDYARAAADRALRLDPATGRLKRA
jgi:ABC-type iron transport system FetAB ATPase subunit